MKKVFYKKTFLVVVEKLISIEFTEEMLGGRSAQQYLDEFSRSMWEVESMDDVGKYAANMAATCGEGYNHDAIGLLARKGVCGQPSGKFQCLFNEISEDVEIEIADPEWQ